MERVMTSAALFFSSKERGGVPSAWFDALVSGGYRAEVERMQREVLDYLTQPAHKTTAKAG